MKLNTSIKLAILAGLSILVLAACGSGSDTSTGANQAAAESETFTGLFAATVAHPRCVNCHAFNEGGVSARRHRGRSNDCASCHAQEDFRASPTDMTFTNRSASQICNTTIQRRGGTDAMAELLRTSPHVAWAISDGSITVNNQQLRLAPPGNQAQWRELIDRWVAAGSSCE